MNNGYFDNLIPNNDPQKNGGADQTQQSANMGENTSASADGSYSYRGDELNTGREQAGQGYTQFGQGQGYGQGQFTQGSAQNGVFPQGQYSGTSAQYGYGQGGQAQYGAQSTPYEVSYNSQNGTYTYSGGFGNGTAPEKKARKKNKGAWAVAAIALSLVLSCVVGGACGLLAAYAVTPSSGNGNTSVNQPSNEEIINKYTAIIQNPVQNQENPFTKAAEIAHDSVVIIDTFLSEEYEQLNQPSGSGSGVVWTTDGYIVTCNHVVENASIIRVTLTDGKSYVASTVGLDAKTDLAVLKINATDSQLSPCVVRDDSAAPLVLAESVIAIGNPLGVLGGTVTEGVLSALERNITIEGQTMKLMQTSASVNSGNSGGGLFDINGSLIGIVNAKSTGEDVEGLGFAIPISTVRQVANELITNGYVTGRPQIGISIVTVTSENSSYIFNANYYPELKQYATRDIGWGRLSVTHGVYIIDSASVQYADGSEKLEYGDRITYLGGVEIQTSDDITKALGDYSAGDTITLTASRGTTKMVTINIVLGQAGAKN